MKKLIPFLLAFTLLSGCSRQFATPTPPTDAPGAEPDVLTEQQVLDAYDKAAQAYDWFTKGSLPSEAIMVTKVGDPHQYQPVSHPEIKTLSDLEMWLRRYLAPEVVDPLLGNNTCYRDIDGKLYRQSGARERNVYLLDKTVSAEQVTDDHWQVVLTFYADSWEWERPKTTIGYSQTTLDYQKTENGWRFTNFCSSDALDLDAETVYTFTYHSDCLIAYETEMPNWSDLKLSCWLLHSDGAYTEGPVNDLFDRLMDHPAELVATLSELPQEWQNRLLPLLGSTAAWRDATVPDVLTALTMTEPAQQRVVEGLLTAYDATLASWGFVDDAVFSLLIEDRYLTLGPQTGTFPWSYALEGTLVHSGPADTYGMAYDMDCGTLQLTYCKAKDGTESLIRMVTDSAEADYMTWEGVSHGTPAEELLRLYPTAVKADELTGSGFDTCYVYEPTGTKHISFYLQNDTVVRIEVENLLDGRLLN